MRDLMEGRLLDIGVMIIVAGILIILLDGCGQYSQSEDLLPTERCYGPNEEACIIYDEDLLCGYLV